LPYWFKENVFVLSVTQTIFVSANTFWIMFFPLWLSSLGISDIGVGWIFTAGTVISSFSLFVGGRLADVYGRKKIIVIGSMTYTTSILIILFFKNVFGSTFGYLIYCLGTGLFGPAVTIMLMESSPQEVRGTAYAFATRTLPSLPPALLAPLGGYFFDKGMYDVSLLVAFLSFAIITLIYMLFLRETLPKNKSTETSVYIKQSSPTVLNKFLALIILAFGIDILTTRGLNWYIPLFLAKFGYSAFEYSIFISTSTIAITVGSLISGRLTDRIGPVKTATTSWILVTITVYLFAIIPSCPSVAILLYTAWKFVGMISYTAPAILINEYYGQEKKSTAMGIYTSLIRVMTIIGPLLTTYALFFGSKTPFILKSTLTLTSIFILHIAIKLKAETGDTS